MHEQKKQKMSEGKIELFNCDNMELMAKYPDNHFDLAIVDPLLLPQPSAKK